MSQFRTFTVSLVVISALALGGCVAEPAPSESLPPTPIPTISQGEVDPFGPRPEFIEGGSALDNKPLFDWVLNHVSLKDLKDPGKSMANALVKAGFTASKIQFTAPKSGTGLPADQVVISLQVKKSCLIAQRMLDKSFTSTIESALKSGGCLIGETREVTW